MRRTPTAFLATLLAGSLAAGLAAAPAAAEPGDRLSLPGPQAAPSAAAEPLPKVRARAYLLVDLGTGEILAAKNARLPLPPASTLKTLTSIAVLRDVPLDATVRARPRDARQDGSRVGLIPGREYRVGDLLYALLLPSANDAASALARANGGRRATVAEMNAIARELGAVGTRAVNPSGLDAPGQVSTAYDLALIARAALAIPEFARIVATESHPFPTWKGKRLRKPATIELVTTNRLLREGYRGAMGVKTGFTTQAGNTFIGGATRKGRTLVAVILRSRGQTADAAAALLDWGFANRRDLGPVGMLGTAPAATAGAPDAMPSAEASPPEGGTLLAQAGITPLGPDEVVAPAWSWALLAVVVAGGAALLARARIVRRRRERLGYSAR